MHAPQSINKIMILVLFIICTLLFTSSSSATDTLNQGDLFNYSSTSLLSENSRFTLGFTGGYLAINYTNESYKSHAVWIANRNNSIPDTSGVLTIDESGKLKITHNGGDPIVLYAGPTNSSTKVTAVLQDNGNLVVLENSNVLWQSFDHPTDVLLPGMRLGHNLKLTSWLAADNPSPGSLTMEWDYSEHQLIVKRRGIRFWSSGGLLSPENSFENIPLYELSGDNYKFSVSNEGYFTYELGSDQYVQHEEWKTFSMWILDYEGNVREPVDSLRRLIFSSGICDGNTTENGCQRWEGPKCRMDGDRFEVRSGTFLPTDQITIDNESMSFIDCQEFCWNNCSCTVVRDTINTTGCTYYVGPIIDRGLRGGELSYYVIIPGPPSKADRTWIWIVSAAIILIATLGSILLYLRWRRLRLEENFLKELMTSDEKNDASELESGENRGHNLQVFSVSSIKSATNSFSAENKLGQGGFGPVYKGKLVKGQEIAVKRLSKTSGQGLVEFKNELIVIAKLQHRNLVRLLGLCIQGEERLLVYEYMPNKSLDSFIFDPSNAQLQDWNKRFEIIEGIAQGLLYLHKYSRLRIIHRDLKASNILLDKDMNPKISDFGMARIFKANESDANTNRIVGTYGYMSPEYAMEGHFSEKSDVYSFGVLVLEIISGKKNHNVYHCDRPLNLLGYAWELWREGDALELAEQAIKDSSAASKDQILRSINVALLCVEHNPSERPTMSAVVSMLTGDIQQIPTPNLPAFYIGKGIQKPSAILENYSVNDLSLTDLNAR